MDTDIRYIKGLGEARAKLMAKLGIRTASELIRNFPRAYEDRTVFKTIGELETGESVCVRAIAASPARLSFVRQGLSYVKLRVADDTGAMDITFFNQAYIKNSFVTGETYIFYGKVSGNPGRPAMVNPIFERESHSPSTTGIVAPVYPLTAGLSQKHVRSAVREALTMLGGTLPDALPASVTERQMLCRPSFAFENIHFPSDMEALELARRRFIFEELFVLATAMAIMRRGKTRETGRGLPEVRPDDFYSALPFSLTGAQRRAIEEAARDMTSAVPMSRLVQGDVGSGKTVVAAACCWIAYKAGCQSAFMVPTEILANQHYRTLSSMLGPLGVRVGLLTGSLTAKQKRGIYEKLSLGEIDVIVGTHAIISDSVKFFDLALVITDEQHRFGVNQRALLTAKGQSPHVLVMSATPIPRTLALIIYGDLDISVINEMPPGRQIIETFVVGETYRQRINNFIRRLVGEGRQVYIVCPAVEESETSDGGLKAAREYSQILQKQVFPDLRVSLVHGKLPPKEKDAVMSLFSSGGADILVATTVIEVGVDVPNAALIVVENADRFGLSQLHQLRGRVGRGQHKSYCVLFGADSGETSRERLDVMKSTNDGFTISEEDLRLRGPGDFFGSRQHGLPEMRIASLVSDMKTLDIARDEAAALLERDPELKSPENAGLAARIHELFGLSSERLN